MKNPTSLQRSALAAGLLALASASALASDGLASLAYAGGEALAPEHEARMVSMITTPGGSLTRDEVRRQLAEAQRGGTLGEVGEIAETPRVLMARSDANERQTREILAAQEAERARLAAIEAEAEARRQALAQDQAQASVIAQAAPATEATAGPAAGSQAIDATAPATADVASPAPSAPSEEPTDRPAEGPTDRPALAPPELPITRASELPAETLIDKD